MKYNGLSDKEVIEKERSMGIMGLVGKTRYFL